MCIFYIDEDVDDGLMGRGGDSEKRCYLETVEQLAGCGENEGDVSIIANLTLTSHKYHSFRLTNSTKLFCVASTFHLSC
jgi:hypothetical protein